LFASDAAECIAELIDDPMISRRSVPGRMRMVAAVAAGAAVLTAVAMCTRRRPAVR
jgi:hypothetical protein